MPQGNETQRVIGAFIAAAGVGLLALTIASLRETWAWADAWGSILLALAALALSAAAVAVLFPAINPEPVSGAQSPNDLAAPVPSIAPPVPVVPVIPVILSVALLSLATLAVAVIAERGRPTSVYDTYVLHIPTAEAPRSEAAKPEPPPPARAPLAAGGAEPSQAQATTTTMALTVGSPKPEQATHSARTALLTWAVQREPHVASGALPMFLGAILTIAFGLWFPHLTFDQAEPRLAFAGKLLAPLLSLGLVGIGTGQHVTSEKIKADAQLAEKGLPPYVSLPAKTQNDVRLKVYLADSRSFSSESLEQLNKKFDALQTAFDSDVKALERNGAGDAAVSGRLAAVSGEVEGLRTAINQRQPVEVKLDAADRDMLNGAIRKMASARVYVTPAADRTEACDKVRKGLAGLAEQPGSTKLREEAAAMDRDHRKLGSRISGLFRGKRPPDGSAKRREADALDNQAAILQQQSVYCAVTPVTVAYDARPASGSPQSQATPH